MSAPVVTHLQTEAYPRSPQHNEALNQLEHKAHQHRSRLIARRALGLPLTQPEAPGVDLRNDRSDEVIRLSQNFDEFYEAQRWLDHLDKKSHDGYVPYEQKRSHIEVVAAFNHIVRDIIDQHPRMKMSELIAFGVEIFGKNKHLSATERFAGMFAAVANGMRHEIAAEQIIGTIPGVEIVYDDQKPGESERAHELRQVHSDMHGRDIRVLVGNTELDIDIKASKKSAIMSGYHSRHPENIIWSGITTEEFGDDLRISPALARQKAAHMEHYLLRAARAYTVSQKALIPLRQK